MLAPTAQACARGGMPCVSAGPGPDSQVRWRRNGDGFRPSVLGALFTAVLGASDARAEQPTFARFDIPTVFYISKSDDYNRVDFGIRLDAECAPTKDDAVFPYWREFEKAPPVRIHTFGAFDYIGYGMSEQRVLRKAPPPHFVRLRQFQQKPITILTTKDPDGRCSAQARTAINGKESQLTFVYVKLRSGFLVPSVEFIDVHGKDLQTGQDVVERIRR